VTYRLEYEGDVDAECPNCSTDLVCPECDKDDLVEDLISEDLEDLEDLSALPRTTQTLSDQLTSLYEQALDAGRYQDKDFLTGLIDWIKHR